MAENLDETSLGLATGTVFGVAMFLLGLLAWQISYGAEAVTLLSSFYVGYEATLVGSLLGGVWGFVDGFIGGFAVAWLYNFYRDRVSL